MYVYIGHNSASIVDLPSSGNHIAHTDHIEFLHVLSGRDSEGLDLFYIERSTVDIG